MDQYLSGMKSQRALAQHGEELGVTVPDLARIQARIAALPDWRQSTVRRAVDAFYQLLAETLAGQRSEPPARRAETARAMVARLEALFASSPREDLLIPAISAVTDLCAMRARTRGAGATFDPAAAIAEAHDAVAALLASFAEVPGASAALHAFPNLVYQLGRTFGPDGHGPERYREVANFLAESLPRAGITQALVAERSAALSRALEAAPRTPADALARAKDALLAQMRRASKAALDDLCPLPWKPGLGRAGSPRTAIATALAGVVRENPAGPEALYSAAAQVESRTASALRARPGEETAAAGHDLAEIIEGLSRSPAALRALEAIKDAVPMILTKAPARAALAEGDLAGALLLSDHMAEAVARDAELRSRLRRRPLADQVAIAGQMRARCLDSDRIARALASLLLSAAERAPGACDRAVFKGLFDRFNGLWGNGRLQDREDLVAPLALARPTEALKRPWVLLPLTAMVRREVPGVPLEALLDDTEDGPGLFALAAGEGERRDPEQYLKTLLGTLKEAKPPEDLLPPLVHRAMGVAAELARLGHPPDALFTRLLADWRDALKAPGGLAHALRPATSVVEARASLAPASGRSSLAWARESAGQAPRSHSIDEVPGAGPWGWLPRAPGLFSPRSSGRSRTRQPANRGVPAARGLLWFLRLHPELPPELAVSAGRALDDRQLTWLVDQLAGARTHDQARAIRDACFACLEHDKLALLDALRRTALPRPVMAELFALLAQEQRQARAGALDFPAIIADLDRGVNPTARILASRAGEVLKGLLPEGAALDQEGLRILEERSNEINALLAFLPEQGTVYSQGTEFLRRPLLGAIAATADGTWPAPKYESEAARRHLAMLTPPQRDVWRAPFVSAASDGARAVAPSAEIELLAKLPEALKAEVQLDELAPGAVGWDATGEAGLQARRDEVVGRLRQTSKGTVAHRSLSAEAGRLAHQLTVVRFYLGLARALAEPGAERVAVIRALDPAVASASAALWRLGAKTCAAALDRVAAALAEAGPLRRRIEDDDRIGAYLTSFGDRSCLNPNKGENRGGLVEFITGSQYRMLRALDGDMLLYRGMLRLFRARWPGYEGPALWVDEPLESGGRGSDSEMARRFVAHAFRKATAMGIPLITVGGTAAPPGAKATQLEVAVEVDRGTTGMHHHQGVDRLNYFVTWPGISTGYDTRRRPDEKADAWQGPERSCSVIRPA